MTILIIEDPTEERINGDNTLVECSFQDGCICMINIPNHQLEAFVNNAYSVNNITLLEAYLIANGFKPTEKK